MSVSYFNRKDEKPTIIVFENSLKVDEFRLWRSFSSNISALYPNVTTEWEFLSEKLGWFLTYKSEDTLLFYVVPDGYCFHINFVFDEATVARLRALDLPQDIMKSIERGKKTDRGYSFYWPVHDTKDVEIVESLTQVQYETMLKEEKEKNKQASSK